MYNSSNIVYVHILDETVPLGRVALLRLISISIRTLPIFGIEVNRLPVKIGFSLNLKYNVSASE